MPVLLPVGSLENLGYRRFEVVVNALLGDSAEELEGQTVPRQEGLQALVGEGVDEGSSTVTKPHAEQMHPSFLSPEAYHRLPPIHLSLFPRGGLQGKKTLLRGDLFFISATTLRMMDSLPLNPLSATRRSYTRRAV